MISFLIQKRLVESLPTLMNAGLDPSSPYYVKSAKLGRLLADPTTKIIYLCVFGGNPQDPNQRDRLTSVEDGDVVFKVAPRELGNANYWWCCGQIELGCWFASRGYNEMVAAETAHTVMGRLMKAVEDCKVNDLREPNEQAIKLFVTGKSMFEGGGNNMFHWTGTLLWRCLTERSFSS